MNIAILVLLVISLFSYGNLKVRGYEINMNWPALVVLILFIIKIV